MAKLSILALSRVRQSFGRI